MYPLSRHLYWESRTTEEMRNALESSSSSNWVRQAIVELSDRDVVDVLNDLEFLTGHFTRKMCGIMAAHRQKNRQYN